MALTGGFAFHRTAARRLVERPSACTRTTYDPDDSGGSDASTVVPEPGTFEDPHAATAFPPVVTDFPLPVTVLWG